MVLSKFLSPTSRTSPSLKTLSFLFRKQNIGIQNAQEKYSQRQYLQKENTQNKHSQNRHSQTKLRLLILNQFFPPDFAATGQLIEELARHLVSQNLEVEVFTGQPAYAFQKEVAPVQECIDGVSVHRSRMTHVWFQRIIFKVCR